MKRMWFSNIAPDHELSIERARGIHLIMMQDDDHLYNQILCGYHLFIKSRNKAVYAFHWRKSHTYPEFNAVR